MPEPAATAERTAQEVRIENSGPAKKRLTITIPAEVINERLEQSLATLAGETALPGFRKGKAPVKLLERRFGTTVRTETKNQLVANAYASAIEEHNLKPLGDPEPSDELKNQELVPDKPFTFSLEVEVLPDFELPSFDHIEIKKPLFEISSAQVDTELKRQQTIHGTATKIESNFEPGDRLSGYAAVARNSEDEPFFRQDHVQVIVPDQSTGGAGQVLGLMVENLSGLLAGKKVGDTITIDITGPNAHEREDIRGVKLGVTFEIRSAERIDPATPAVVAERYGLPNEEVLQEQIRLALEHRRDHEQASAMREQAVEQLADAVEMELPEKLSAQQAARMLEIVRLDLLSRGETPEQVEERLAMIRTDTEAQARNRLKRFFLLHRLGEHFHIEVSEQEINGRIASIAAQRNVRADRLRAELVQAGRIGEVTRLIRDEKAADRLVQQVKRVEISADEWNRLFKEKQSQIAASRRKHEPSTSRSRSAQGSAATSKGRTTKKTTGK